MGYSRIGADYGKPNSYNYKVDTSGNLPAGQGMPSDTLTAEREGRNFDNVQDYMDFVFDLNSCQVGEIFATTTNVDPNGIGAIEQIVITGGPATVQNIITVHNWTYVAAVSETAEQVITGLYTDIQSTPTGLLAHSNPDANTIELVWNKKRDTWTYLESIDFTIDQNIMTEHNETIGYGTWTNIGSETKFSETWTYWKRDS